MARVVGREREVFRLLEEADGVLAAPAVDSLASAKALEQLVDALTEKAHLLFRVLHVPGDRVRILRVLGRLAAVAARVPLLQKALCAPFQEEIVGEAMVGRLLHTIAAANLAHLGLMSVDSQRRRGLTLLAPDLYRIASACCVALEAGPALACAVVGQLPATMPRRFQLADKASTAFCDAVLYLVGVVGAAEMDGEHRVARLIRSTLLSARQVADFVGHLVELQEAALPPPPGRQVLESPVLSVLIALLEQARDAPLLHAEMAARAGLGQRLGSLVAMQLAAIYSQSSKGLADWLDSAVSTARVAVCPITTQAICAGLAPPAHGTAPCSTPFALLASLLQRAAAVRPVRGQELAHFGALAALAACTACLADRLVACCGGAQREEQGGAVEAAAGVTEDGPQRAAVEAALAAAEGGPQGGAGQAAGAVSAGRHHMAAAVRSSLAALPVLTHVVSLFSEAPAVVGAVRLSQDTDAPDLLQDIRVLAINLAELVNAAAQALREAMPANEAFPTLGWAAVGVGSSGAGVSSAAVWLEQRMAALEAVLRLADKHDQLVSMGHPESDLHSWGVGGWCLVTAEMLAWGLEPAVQGVVAAWRHSLPAAPPPGAPVPHAGVQATAGAPGCSASGVSAALPHLLRPLAGWHTSLTKLILRWAALPPSEPLPSYDDALPAAQLLRAFILLAPGEGMLVDCEVLAPAGSEAEALLARLTLAARYRCLHALHAAVRALAASPRPLPLNSLRRALDAIVDHVCIMLEASPALEDLVDVSGLLEGLLCLLLPPALPPGEEELDAVSAERVGTLSDCLLENARLDALLIPSGLLAWVVQWGLQLMQKWERGDELEDEEEYACHGAWRCVNYAVRWACKELPLEPATKKAMTELMGRARMAHMPASGSQESHDRLRLEAWERMGEEVVGPLSRAMEQRQQAQRAQQAQQGSDEGEARRLAARLEMARALGADAGCSYVGCTSLVGASEAGMRVRRCSGCGVVKYCSQDCQRRDWGEQHGAVCAQLRGVGTGGG